MQLLTDSSDLIDVNFKKQIETILTSGHDSHYSRARYKDGRIANSKYIIGAYESYDISNGKVPITSLRKIAWKSAIKEILWIYQDQSNDLSVLKNKYNVNYWDDWDIGNGTIGHRYGYIVKKHDIINRLLNQLKNNPFNRRNVISLWDYDEFDNTDGLYPCAFNFMIDIKVINNEYYVDATLTQRSNDLLVAHHINAIQYIALQMMIAKHFGWKVGNFNYFVNNLHIYDNQFEQANELLSRKSVLEAPSLVLNCPDNTNFYDIKIDHFELINYHPNQKQLKFDLAI